MTNEPTSPPRKTQKARAYPGSVFKPTGNNRLYIKYGGRRIATGLAATKEGWDYAEMLLKKMHLRAIGLLVDNAAQVTVNDEKLNLPELQHLTFADRKSVV